jgi:hypothetical protein
VAFVAKPATYTASSGKTVNAGDVDLLVRALSMGKLHHAMMGTAAVAIGTAAAVPGTLVNLAAGGGEREAVRFGHPSGTLRVGAQAAGRRPMDRDEGHHEPQRTRADGRLGSRAGRRVLSIADAICRHEAASSPAEDAALSYQAYVCGCDAVVVDATPGSV